MGNEDRSSPKTLTRQTPPPTRIGDLAALVRAAETSAPSTLAADPDERMQRQRQMVASLCRLLSQRTEQPAAKSAATQDSKTASPPPPNLAPRLQQTLQGLLEGDGEKQIARKLNISQHTVHVYVKHLYRHFEVCSRGELLARFVQR